jgi:hypothetical protein
MKKIVASVGLAAIGASGIESASAQALVAPDASKPWSVAVTLRGFYDDNVSTLPNNAPVPPGEHRDSYGFEVSPSAALLWSVEQTTVNLGVLYSLKYYDNKPINSTDHSDQSFSFNAGVNHSFSEETKLRVSDSFVIGQEPDMLRAGSTFSTFQRISGDNIRNYGSIGLETQITPQFGIGAGYDNAYYDYKNSGVTYDNFGDIVPSLSGVLDRIENRAHVEFFWRLNPETKLLLGYQFSDVGYTSDELIGGQLFGLVDPIYARDRDSRQHTIYVGAEHSFTPELTGAVRAGGSYTEYYNDSNADHQYTPYVNASLRYSYAPESHLEAGFSYDRSPTDVVGNGLSTATLDAESAVVFVDLTHRITPFLFATLTGQFQNSKYNGGVYDGKEEQFYLAGINLEYRFTHYFSAHAGYDYDRLESQDIGRTFDRNRVYIGITATY